MQCTYAREQRYFASQLHGPVQSVLTAASMRIAAIEPRTPEWNSALNDVTTDFERIVEQLIIGPDSPIDIDQSLRNLRQTWAGVCEINVAVDDDVISTLNADWIASGIVADLLVEACANAAIHGAAKNVHVDIRWCAGDEMEIVVVNDGLITDDGPPGMGTAMLDRVAITWSRKLVSNHLQLRVVIAVPRNGHQEASSRSRKSASYS